MTELDINSDVGNIDGSIFSNEDTLVLLVGYREGESTNTHPHTNNTVKSIKIGKLTDQYDTANTNMAAPPAPSFLS